MTTRRRDRVRASQQAMADLSPAAARRALAKARAEGRTYPTSGQRRRAARRR
jgi:hypothetical protein